MIPLATVQGLSVTLNELSTRALADLQALLVALEGQSPERTKAVLFEAFPEVFDPYVAATSAVSATFYEEVRAVAGVKPTFDAATINDAPRKRWNSLVGFGTAPAMFEQGVMALMFSAMAGGLTKTLTQMSSDTIIGNAERERVQVGFQRVPAPGCCAFCGMLASRGAAYESEAGATKVAGRGMPIGSTAGKRGGQAKGIRTRGTQRIGEDFHDHCKCRGVPVFEDNYVEMQADADRYLDSYTDAFEKVNDGLELNVIESMTPNGDRHNEYEWIDAGGNVLTPKQRLNSIVTAMRHDLGVK